MATLHSNAYGPCQVDRLPNRCPKCHHVIVAMQQGHFIQVSNVEIEVPLLCPGCQRLFLATFKRTSVEEDFALRKTEPSWPAPQSFGMIDGISPTFIELYNQGTSAEGFGLNQIAGGGYRKALEFLIKDYCIRSSPEKRGEIERRPLLQVINEYLDNGKIKEAAKRTAWLGNDEIHYIRRWEDKDLADLKNLLRLTITAIEESLEFAKYMASMEKPR